MKTYKEVTRKIEIEDKTLCDWCGKEILYYKEPYIFSIDVEYKHSYSDYGDAWTEMDSWKVDLCPYCINKIRKFLEDNGVKVQETGGW